MRTSNYNVFMRDFANAADVMNRMFDARSYDYARNGGSNGETERPTRLPLDAYATEDAFVMHAYLPGVKPEDVEITFEGEELTIRGKFQPISENVEYVRSELYHGAFERRLTFNVPVNGDGIEATFENGVLTLSVPKAEAIKPKQIKVQVK
ncbi:MAG: Hsp20/alpha crystallin family protein [Anaerolineales bacterium]|nr:Hsp20/alpha crystallin family protein [Anaerolineales bacterium]